MNLQELLERTLETTWAGRKDEEGLYKNGLDVVTFLGPATAVSGISSKRVGDLKVALREKGLAPATINRKLAALSVMMTVAQREGHLDRRPLVDREREPEGRSRFLTQEEQDRIVFHLAGTGYQRLVLFLVDTGLRVGEALHLSWDAVGDNAVTVRNTKGGRPRTVPLTTQAAAIVRQDAADRHEQGPFGGYSQSAFNKAWTKARRAAGLADDKDVVPHILRHTCASRLMQRGAHPAVVQRWLGHRDLKTTMRYAHLNDDALMAAVGLL